MAHTNRRRASLPQRGGFLSFLAIIIHILGD